MSKKKRYDKSYKYNRQTKAYFQSQARAKMKELGLRSPDPKHLKTVSRASKILFILWIPFIIIATIRYGLLGMLTAMFLALAYVFGIFLYVSNHQTKLVTAYLEMGISKDVYMAEMKKRRRDERSLAKLSALWDKAERKFYRKEQKQKKKRRK